VIGILAGTDKTGGRSIAARINGFLKDRGATEKNIKLSVRIGMASYPDDAITKEELIKTAEGRVSGEKEDAS
jgi:GGDEF domain-containing protein